MSGHNFSPDDPCSTCSHGWHGEPCALRVYIGVSGSRSLPNKHCPCPGAFGVLAQKESASA